MNNNCFVSIILPVYNAQNFVIDTIKSVKNQTYDNWELVIVDDGSVDKSLALCMEMAQNDKRIRVYSKSNGGVSSARNYGLKKAKGRYIAFIDDDDKYDRDFIEDGVSYMIRYDADFYKCGRNDVYYNGAGEIVRNVVRRYPFFFSGDSNTFKSIYMQYRKSGIAAPVWNSIYKREIIVQEKIEFDESLRLGQEDISFNSRYCRYIKEFVISEKSYYMHNIRKGMSTSSKFSLEQLDAKRVSIEEEKNLLDHRFDEEFDALKVVECLEISTTSEQKEDFDRAVAYMEHKKGFLSDAMKYQKFCSMTRYRRFCFFLISCRLYNLYFGIMKIVKSIRRKVG